MKKIDPAFLEFPMDRLGEAALEAASREGAGYADFRLERQKGQDISVRDLTLESLANTESVGYSVRVLVDGSWGFASSETLSPEAATQTARRAMEVARMLASLNQEAVELADEPPHDDEYVSDFEIDPFSVPDGEKVDFLRGINQIVLDSGKVNHVDFRVHQVLENKYLASTAGSRIVQQRIRLSGNFEAVKTDASTGAFETMRSNAVPVGEGWEYLSREYDFAEEARRIPELLDEKMKSPSIEPGRYDLVIDPTNLWLTIHESIGHATELDRVLGYEANYAGTSFATLDKLNNLQYGSPVMHVTGDRIAPHGLSTVGYDDEGVEAQQWDLIRDGILVGYQLNRHMAHKQGFGRSNGCAFADSPHHVPMQRMPNVSLQPSEREISLDDLIGGVERGIYAVGDKSWSIDMQRYNFQFTAQRFYEIKGGKLSGQLKDVAYQSVTTDFWNSMEAVGGPSTYLLAGAFNCGKGQPGQVAPVSHGSPAALFRSVNILNTAQESG